jgi:hypothetical protein
MRVLSVFAATVAALVLGGPVAHAAPSPGSAPPSAEAGRTGDPDPYLDAIAPESTIPVINGADLLGAPDDRFATIDGRQFRFLLLDLGAGEEGVGDLEVRYRNPYLTLGKMMDVNFVDRHGHDLGWARLFLPGSGTRVTTVDNPSALPYRYVRLMTGLQTLDVDSMKAAAPA